MFLRNNGQKGKLTHVVFECRGKAEDAELELAFRRIVAGQNKGDYLPEYTGSSKSLILLAFLVFGHISKTLYFQ